MLARPLLLIVAAVVACSAYANLSFLVTRPSEYRLFPPFERGLNLNENRHLGGEYYHIARALRGGRGYADPFRIQTGPTAWMPPVLSYLLAALRCFGNDNTTFVTAAVVVLKDIVLAATGLVFLALAYRTTGRRWLPALLFVAALVYNFRRAFQHMHDAWIVLAALDLIIAGLIWTRPLTSTWLRAAGWGVLGGLCALISPVVGFVWGLLGLLAGWRRGRRTRLTLAYLLAAATIAPWVVRNYLEFGRFIPIKSNLAFELYQSQCVQPGGVLHAPIWLQHPNFPGGNAERREYVELGETAYLEHKKALFLGSVAKAPGDFARRIGRRFLEATLFYVPFNTADVKARPGRVLLARCIYPIPFFCLLAVLLSAWWRPLNAAQRLVIAVYVAFLFPYILISYYERYKFPLIGVEVLLVVFTLDRFLSGWKQFRAKVKADEEAALVNL